MVATPIEIEAIKANAASQYGVDLASASNDEVRLKALVSAPTEIDSAQIYGGSATFSFEKSLAFVPDLETFAFSDVGPDDRLYSRRIEQNLDEAIRYVQNCLQLRKDYAETAKLRNDTRFKSEEFFRLDSVHLEEVAAGLYKLPWMEAADDNSALQEAVAQTAAQQNTLEEMLQAGAAGKRYSAILSDPSVNDFIAKSAQLARDSAGNNPLEVSKGAVSTTTYRTNLEYATWIQALAAIKANISQLRGKLSTAQRKEVYLRKDEGFRAHRAAISRYLAYLQVGEHCRQNSVINYAERLERQGDLFKSNLVGLIQRTNALMAGIRERYDIDIPLSPPETGQILDRISVWLADVQNEVSKVKRTHRLSIVSVWTASPIKTVPRADGESFDIFEADIAVAEAAMPPKSMLRGVAFEYLGQQSRPLGLKVLPPQSAYDAARKNGDTDKLMFGRVCQFSPAAEVKPQHVDVFWNGSAPGVWQIEGTFDRNAGALDAVVMHLWIASP